MIDASSSLAFLVDWLAAVVADVLTQLEPLKIEALSQYIYFENRSFLIDPVV